MQILDSAQLVHHMVHVLPSDISHLIHHFSILASHESSVHHRAQFHIDSCSILGLKLGVSSIFGIKWTIVTTRQWSLLNVCSAPLPPMVCLYRRWSVSLEKTTTSPCTANAPPPYSCARDRTANPSGVTSRALPPGSAGSFTRTARLTTEKKFTASEKTSVHNADY